MRPLDVSVLPGLKSIIWWYLVCLAYLFTYCLSTSSQTLLMRWFHNSWNDTTSLTDTRWSPSGPPSFLVVSTVNCKSCPEMTACEAVWSVIIVSHQSQHTHTLDPSCMQVMDLFKRLPFHIFENRNGCEFIMKDFNLCSHVDVVMSSLLEFSCQKKKAEEIIHIRLGETAP